VIVGLTTTIHFRKSQGFGQHELPFAKEKWSMTGEAFPAQVSCILTRSHYTLQPVRLDRRQWSPRRKLSRLPSYFSALII